MLESAPKIEEEEIGLSKVPPNTLKHGDTFAVFGIAGDVLSGDGPHQAQGLFHKDTRYVSRFVLTVDGQCPSLLSTSQSEDNAELIFHYRHATSQPVWIVRERFIFRDTWFERIEFSNTGGEACHIEAALEFACDFADIFEARGAVRARRGQYDAPVVSEDAATLGYVGLDSIARATCLRFAPGPTLLDEGGAHFQLEIQPGIAIALYVEIACEKPPEGNPERNFPAYRAQARQAREAIAARAASATTGSGDFNRLLQRTCSDLDMLLTETPQGLYPYAGIPWYSTAFGRDGLLTAIMTLWMDPQISLGVLRYLAANQARRIDPRADAEPGKILHEVRRGEMAETGEVPFRRYYGSIDSTPLFLMLAGAYLERTGDLVCIRELWPGIEAAADWLDRYGDWDNDGLYEYHRESENGLTNQGWKDSKDAVFHADGALAPASIALCEVQGYVYQAKRRVAEMARALGRTAQATLFDKDADDLRRQVEMIFWSNSLSNYVLALDGAKHPCAVQASNAGHLLFCGLPSAERAAKVAETLMSEKFYSGWGIRTIAEGEARYDARSYHNGSIWPHDNALIGMGFAAYGMREETARVLQGLYEASLQTESRRLPELFAGYARHGGKGPVPSDEIACSPQAWVTATPLGLLQACLGLGFDVAKREVYFQKPYLPDFLGGQVVLRRLALGGATIDVALEGDGYDVRLQVLDRTGQIDAVLR